jgi:hypothetical protein
VVCHESIIVITLIMQIRVAKMERKKKNLSVKTTESNSKEKKIQGTFNDST